MPSVFVTTPPFPSVPALPGVPQLLRSPVVGAAVALIPALISQLLPPATPEFNVPAAKAAPIWGIFDEAGTAMVITPDSMLAQDYRAEYKLASYAVQAGQFANYNKVKVAQEQSIRMVIGQDLTARTQFQKDCQTVVDSIDLYTIVTPERSYVNVNAYRLEIARRETAGSFFIEAEMFFQEIQQVTPQYSSTTTATNTANAQAPSAVPTANSGIVQPRATSFGTQALVTDILQGIPPTAYQPSFLPNPLD